jgi:hypothetical protein
MAVEAIFSPIDLFEGHVRAMVENKRARLRADAAYRDPALAAKLVGISEAVEPNVSESVLRVLVCTARDAELHPMVSHIIAEGSFREQPQFGRRNRTSRSVEITQECSRSCSLYEAVWRVQARR